MPLLCCESGVDNLDICDICRSPLLICNKVSGICGFEWNTFVQNVFDEFDKKYDIVINDAFLPRFLEKLPVLKAISSCLVTHGYYITTLKQGKQNSGGVSSERKQAFIKKAIERNHNSSSIFSDLFVEQIAHIYAQNMASFPVSCEKEILSLFKGANLTIEQIECARIGGEFEESDYFRIIARKDL